MRRLILAAVLLLILSVTQLASAQENHAETRYMTHDAVERTFHVYAGDEADKLLVVLHPFASSGRAMEVITGFNQVADEQGFVVAYPDSVDMFWDDGGFDDDKPGYEFAVDDFGYITQLMDDLSAEFNLAERYVTGMGNGGQFTYALACQMPEQLDGIALVATLMIDHVEQNCAGTEATSGLDVIIIHGQNDHSHLDEGRTFETGGYILSSEATFITWLERNQCDPDSRLNYRQTTLVSYDSCNDGSRTAFYSVIGGGNNWFRANDSINNYDIDATTIISAFINHEDAWYELTQQPEPDSDRVPRTFTLYLPPTTDFSIEMPLVVLLHGKTANASSQAYSSAFNRVAKRENIVALYPEGLETVWNYGKDIEGYPTEAQDDDVFLDMLIDDIARDVAIDRDSMYVTGLSNGGLMTQRLACTRAETYAAFASVAATAPFGLSQLCEDTPPAPILIMMGTADSIMPWQGYVAQDAEGRPFYITAPMDATAAFWADHNGCATSFERNLIPSTDPDSEVQVWTFNDCPDDAQTLIYGVVGGGHVWHGARDFENALLGEVNMDINASEEIWTFFKQHSYATSTETVSVEQENQEQEQVEQDETDNSEAEATAEAQIETPEPSEAQETSETQQYEQQRAIISELRGGGYTIYYILDLDEEFACSDDTEINLPNEVLEQVQGMQEAFELMEFPIGRVSAVDDCRALAVSELLYGEPSATLPAIDSSNLFLLLSRPAPDATLHLIIGDNDVISQELQRDIPAGNSFISIPQGASGYQGLSLVPNTGWENLGSIYRIITDAEGENAILTPDERLIAGLQNGEYVVYIRHAVTDRTETDTDLSSCETQRNLNDEGIEQATAIGEAFAALDVSIGEIISTGYCRTDDTARLIAGVEPTIEENFFQEGVLTTLLSSPPVDGNRIIIGHGGIILDTTGLLIAEGEAIIFVPQGNGWNIERVLTANEWNDLANNLD